MVREGLKRLAALAAAAAFLGCVPLRRTPPPAPREFRGAWVASVANIDWPSRPGLGAEAQRQEARDLVALARARGLNALILQVRPGADALYPSALEPWSEYLTGEQGRPPSPCYDPLAFWIREAHAAGLELHAWFNPYRARPSSAHSPLAPGHVARARPGLVRAYGDQLWLDPGEPEALERALAVILDVVRRYDVDGVHIDDYFYPYPVKDAAGQPVDFPDEAPWRAYLAAGGTLSRPDWRRHNVDALVERIYAEVHRVRPTVRVGVSPFGVGRPGPGFSQYEELYADVETWLARGWVDYLAPQLYWKRDSPGQPFGPLLDYWQGRNVLGRHVWPGLFTSRILGPDPWPAEEIIGQIREARDRRSGGHVHFSLKALRGEAGAALAYDGPALVPASPWLGAPAPQAPVVSVKRTADGLRVQAADCPWLLALWARYGSAWRFFTLPGGEGTLPGRWEGAPLGPVWASSIGRTGGESPLVAVLPEAPHGTP
ncbi:glycoside hydrolase family 10 protein [Mesoterricola silvestris]|uniref:UPF0748 protein YngK n=1 Tax=Mesoterricola silvestris TaxID=2927979 RepID=A0AA48GNM6_9BACT|nr:family 10 glycosylhydrolase [Mesoterricola silvestris]BDU72850.1 UPF0748 protein YngK [Mesoterricola silvestris]